MSIQRFKDDLEIAVEAGRGGDGAVSFAQFKYQPKAGPDGGDGGKGGDVIFVGDESLEGLEHLASKPRWKARSGENGTVAKKQGPGADSLELTVPLGTIVHDRETRFKVAEITQHGMKHLIARGGRGGRGNVHFATPKNKTPRRADNGEEGEKRDLALTYRIYAVVQSVMRPRSRRWRWPPGKAVVTMNSEFHVTVGSHFVGAGLVTEAEGDQSGSLAALAEEVRAMGFVPRIFGNTKGYLNLNPKPEDMAYWAAKQGIQPGAGHGIHGWNQGPD